MKVIFINYVPGSFGSFLYHCIAESPECYKINSDNAVFWDNGAAHGNIVTMIFKFHDGDELRMWLELTDEQKQEHFAKLTYCPPDFADSQKWYVHRLTIPSMTPEVMRFFPESKFINVTFDDDDISTIARDMTNKTYNPPDGGWIDKMRESNTDYYEQLMRLSEEERLDIYYQYNLNYVKSHQCNDIMTNVYTFPYKSFLNEESFMEETGKLFEWLGIEYADIGQLYSEFKKVNNI